MYAWNLPAGDEPADPSRSNHPARDAWSYGDQIDIEEAIEALEDYARSLGPDDEEGEDDEEEWQGAAVR